MDWCKAEMLGDGHVLPKPSTIAASEWTLNLAGLPHLNMAGLMIYLMEICFWKDDAVILNIQEDLTEGDTVSGLVVS